MRVRSLVPIVFVAACSSAATSSSSGGSFGSAEAAPTGSDFSAPGTPHQNACQQTEPDEGASCDDTAEVFQCEYGTEAIPICDRLWECVRDSASSPAEWRTHETTGGVCGSCSSTIPTEGDACSTIGALCTYYEGTCGCLDGGDGGAPSWRCTKPQQGCPARRPRLGTSCVHEMTCDYGSCLFGAPLAFSCKTGAGIVTAWEQSTAEECP